MPKFKTPYNAEEFPHPKIMNFQPSLTIPDQSLTPRQLLVRHTKGLPLGGQWPAAYDDDDNDDIAPDWKKMDLAEREQFQKNATEELDELQNRFKQKKQKQKPPAEKEEENTNTP